MKQVILLIMITALAGCGGVHKARKDSKKRVPRPVPVVSTPSNPVSTGISTVPAAAPARRPFANGPINKACMASERKARSRALCGCIQSVADDTLTGSQQRVAVGFYGDPHKAQVMRQSDNSAHEKFWLDYKNYGDTAKRVCG